MNLLAFCDILAFGSGEIVKVEFFYKRDLVFYKIISKREFLLRRFLL